MIENGFELVVACSVKLTIDSTFGSLSLGIILEATASILAAFITSVNWETWWSTVAGSIQGLKVLCDIESITVPICLFEIGSSGEFLRREWGSQNLT